MNAPARQGHPFGRTEEEDLTILKNDGDSGWWDENGRPAPWPQDFLATNTGWAPASNLQTPAEHPPF